MQKISIDEFANFKFVANPTFSPNGKNFCFTVYNADLASNNYKSYIYAIKDNQIIRLTGLAKESSFQFIDDDTILFAGNRTDDKDFSGSKFYKISLNGGEAEEYLSFPIRLSNLNFLDNGDILANGRFLPNWPELYKNEEEYVKKYQEYLKENADYEEIEENPFWFNGSTFTRGARGAIYYYHNDTKTLEMLTDVSMDAHGIVLTKDKNELYFHGNTSVGYRNHANTNLYKMNLSTKEIVEVINHKDLSVSEVLIADSFLYVLGNKQEYGSNTNNDIYKLTYDTNELSKICDFGEANHSTVASDVRYGGGQGIKVVGDTLYTITTLFDKAVLQKIENGQIETIIDKEGSIDSFDIYENKLRLVALYDMKGTEIYDENLTQITHFNDAVLEDKYVAIPETLNFQSVQDEIHGFVLKPIDFDENKKYPVIIDIHGGPKTAYGAVFYHEMQYWASEGYFVIYCNPTGSDGRGNEFADIRGKYGTTDYQDLMNFCDAALEKYPQMDKDNFFETGGSYGGFMTNWIIGHTNRFKACASQRSISNWFSFYGVSDIGVSFTEDQQASTPFDNPEKLWWHSPLKYADKVTTPTLFIHSNEDYRCPMPEGMQMFTALKAHGVESKLVYFRGENHELSRSGKPIHRIKRLKEITQWFNNHLD